MWHRLLKKKQRKNEEAEKARKACEENEHVIALIQEKGIEHIKKLKVEKLKDFI